MTFTTKFDIGDRVRNGPLGRPFTVTEIRIQTLGRYLYLTKYRQRRCPSGRTTTWRAEKFLEKIEEPKNAG